MSEEKALKGVVDIEAVINARGELAVNTAAKELKEAITAFERACGLQYVWVDRYPGSDNSKRVAKMLRALADYVDPETDQKTFLLHKEYWDAAKEAAKVKFLDQFNALTRFIENASENTDLTQASQELQS